MQDPIDEHFIGQQDPAAVCREGSQSIQNLLDRPLAEQPQLEHPQHQGQGETPPRHQLGGQDTEGSVPGLTRTLTLAQEARNRKTLNWLSSLVRKVTSIWSRKGEDMEVCHV